MLEKLKALAAHLKQEFEVYRLVLKHPETPLIAKFFLGLAVGYLLMPFDLIPDFIPVIGQLDELVIIPILLYLALLFIPKRIIQSCREQVNKSSWHTFDIHFTRRLAIIRAFRIIGKLQCHLI